MNEFSPLKVGTTASPEKERENLRDAFLSKNGYESSAFQPLPVDASRRRYFRGPNVLLMDAPPPSEDIMPFQRVAEIIQKAGLTVPKIYHSDPEIGLMLVEDFGQLSYRIALEKGLSESLLYTETVKALAHLHKQMPLNSLNVKPYNLFLFLENVGLFIEWNEGHFTPQAKEDFLKIWEEAFHAQPVIPQSLCLRDVMVDNLHWLPERQEFHRCGFIDFQDAVWGPITYDLVSLLEDARREVSLEFAREMIKVYFEEYPDLSQEDFWSSYSLWGAQRSTRILGVFSRLSKRDGKHQYLKHMPRVWKYLQRDLSHPPLAAIQRWFHQHVRMP